MDKTALVNVELERGAEILNILDSANLHVSVALWMYPPEYEDWRLILAARQFDEAGTRGAYRLVHDALANSGFSIEVTPPIMMLPMSSPFIKELRRFGKAKNVKSMRAAGRSNDWGSLHR